MAEVNEAKREKSQVEDINRSLYDFRYEEKDAYKVDAGQIGRASCRERV